MENIGKCTNCGRDQVLPDNLARGFCSECGSVVISQSIAQTTEQNPNVNNAPQYSPPPQSAPNYQEPSQGAGDQFAQAAPQNVNQQQYVQPVPQNVNQQPYVQPAPQNIEQTYIQTPPQNAEPPQSAPTAPPAAAINQPPSAPPEYSQQYAAPVQQNIPSNEAYTQAPVLQEQYPQSPTPPPQKTKKPIPKFAFIITAAVVVVVIAAILFVPALAGNSYEKAEADFLGTFSSLFGLGESKGNALSLTLGYTPSSEFEGFIPDLKANAEFSYAANQATGSISLSSSEFKSLSAMFGFDGSEITIQFPEITKYYLSALIPSDDDTFDLNTLDQKKLSTTLDNISKAYHKAIEDVIQTEKNVELTGGNASVKCDMYSIVFTEELIGKLLSEVVKEVRKNTNLMDFITSVLGSANYDAQDMLYELEDLVADMTGTSRLLRMQVWVKSNKVIARTIDRIQGTDMELSYQFLTTNNCIYIDARIRDKDIEYFRLRGSLDKSGGAWSGKVDLVVNEDDYWYGGETTILTATARFENIKKSGNIYTGDIRLSGEFGDYGSGLNLRATLDKKDNNQSIKLTGSMSDGNSDIDLGELIITYSNKSISKVTLQNLDGNMAVYLDEYSEINSEIAADMADDIYDYYYANDEGIVGELLYMLWDFIDEISYY